MVEHLKQINNKSRFSVYAASYDLWLCPGGHLHHSPRMNIIIQSIQDELFRFPHVIDVILSSCLWWSFIESVIAAEAGTLAIAVVPAFFSILFLTGSLFHQRAKQEAEQVTPDYIQA